MKRKSKVKKKIKEPILKVGDRVKFTKSMQPFAWNGIFQPDKWKLLGKTCVISRVSKFNTKWMRYYRSKYYIQVLTSNNFISQLSFWNIRGQTPVFRKV